MEYCVRSLMCVRRRPVKRKPFRLLANLVLLMAFAPCPGALAGQATGQEPDIAHWFTLKAMVNTRPADLHRTVINGPRNTSPWTRPGDR